MSMWSNRVSQIYYKKCTDICLQDEIVEIKVDGRFLSLNIVLLRLGIRLGLLKELGG